MDLAVDDPVGETRRPWELRGGCERGRDSALLGRRQVRALGRRDFASETGFRPPQISGAALAALERGPERFEAPAERPGLGLLLVGGAVLRLVVVD